MTNKDAQEALRALKDALSDKSFLKEDLIILCYDIDEFISVYKQLRGRENKSKIIKLISQSINKLSSEETVVLPIPSANLSSFGWRKYILPLSVLLAIVLIVSLLSQGELSALFTRLVPLPTETAQIVPNFDLADAKVSFLVTHSNGKEEKISSGSILSLKPGDKILFMTEVTIDDSSFPYQLIYQYFTAVGSVPAQQTGPSSSYVAPIQPGPDVISVLITDPNSNENISHSIKVKIQDK